MTRSILTSAALAGAVLFSLAFAGGAEARGHTVTAQGSGGRGFVQTRSVDRTATGATATRGIQTNGGYGASTSRTSSYGGGQYAGSSQTTFNNGSTISRSASAQANGDGTASYDLSRTGVNGQTEGVSGTVSHTGTP